MLILFRLPTKRKLPKEKLSNNNNKEEDAENTENMSLTALNQ